MSDDDLDFETPAETDFHGRKRELLKKGLEQGGLTYTEIFEALPKQHLTDTEMEVLLFTCQNMGIEVTGNRKEARRNA